MDPHAIRTAPPVDDLDTASPRCIDERNARLDVDQDAAEAVISAALQAAHTVAGDRYHYEGRRGRKVWQLSDEDAERITRDRIASGTVPRSHQLIGTPELLDRLDQARHTVEVIERERAVLAEEFRRRGGWSRFFTVPGGHVHSGQRCVGGSIRVRTALGWNPELSGQSEADALAHFGALGHLLCTHCFPTAPVITTPASAPRCPGSGQAYRPGTRRHRHPNGTGECPECGTRRPLTPSGYLRAHPPTAPAPAS